MWVFSLLKNQSKDDRFLGSDAFSHLHKSREASSGSKTSGSKTAGLLSLLIGAGLLAGSLVAPQHSALAAENVGRAEQAVNLVTASLDSQDRQVVSADPVFQQELVSTGARSATKLVFLDGTELTLGENADVTLDEFVYNSGAKSSFVLNVTKGALRFVSGDLPSSAYKIKTPVATLGVRGTDIEILVSRGGMTRLFVRSGMAIMGNGFGRQVLIPTGFSSAVEPTGGTQPATVSTPQPGRDSEMLSAQENMQATLTNPPAPPGDEGGEEEEQQAEEEQQQGQDEERQVAEADNGDGTEDELQLEGFDNEGNIQDDDGDEGVGGQASSGNAPAVQQVMNDANGIGEVPAEIVNAVVNGGGQSQMSNFLTQGNPNPQTVAARAVALSQRLGADPRLRGSNQLLNAHSSIGSVASNAMCSPRVVRMAFDDDYTPPPGAHAFDMGGWNTPLADGFQRVTPASSSVRGSSLQAKDHQGDGAVLQDVITGLSGLDLDVPNGDYNVILVTAEGVAANMKTPFGARFAVNGQSYTLGQSGSADWLDTGVLTRNRGGGNAGAGPRPSIPVAGIGGGIQLTSTVTDGQLHLDFQGNNFGGALSGVIVEPLEVPSSLDLRGAATGGQSSLDDCLEMEFVTEAALSVVAEVSGLATAAGTPNTTGNTGTNTTGNSTTDAAPQGSEDVPNRTLSLSPVVGPTAASNT
ncbi:FecR family protein [Rhodovibrionaceae bacterium A322]